MKNVYLVLVIVILAACDSLQTDPQLPVEGMTDDTNIVWPVTAPPAGIGTITDVKATWMLYGGVEIHQGQAYPDGRVWLYDAVSTRHYRLTSKDVFGQNFFASGGIFISPSRVLIKVNSGDAKETLYLIDLAEGSIRRWLSAAELGLVEIREDSWLLTSEGDKLAFSAAREVVFSEESFAWQRGVYSLDVETQQLETIALEALDVAPGYLLPALDQGRVIAVSQ